MSDPSGAGAGLELGALLPPIDPVAAPFWEGAARGELRIPRCAATGRLFFPPRPTSPFAPRVPPGWATVSGRGTLWSFAVPHPPLLPPFAALAPYVVAVVALEEDPRVRLVGNLVARRGGSLARPEGLEVRIGMPVRAAFEGVSERIHLLRWLADPRP